MSNKQSSPHALAAASIRKELKKHFPLIKFSVTSDSYSGGSSVRATWVDGPTGDQVGKIIFKYQYGHFNGMNDSYEYSNRRDDIPQVKYVQTSREFSKEIKMKTFEELKKTHASFEHLEDMDKYCPVLLDNSNFYSAAEYIFSILCDKDLTPGVIS